MHCRVRTATRVEALLESEPPRVLSRLSTTEGPLLLSAIQVPLCKAHSRSKLTGAVYRQAQVSAVGEAGAGMGRGEEQHTAGITTN